VHGYELLGHIPIKEMATDFLQALLIDPLYVSYLSLYVTVLVLLKNTIFMKQNDLSGADISRIIEMAWEDRTPFEVIFEQYKLSEPQVIKIMRSHMQASSFRMWRERVSGRKTKHLSLRSFKVGRHVCPTQRLR
jgi:uncharacterized protein (TIGR03643 family)